MKTGGGDHRKISYNAIIKPAIGEIDKIATEKKSYHNRESSKTQKQLNKKSRKDIATRDRTR